MKIEEYIDNKTQNYKSTGKAAYRSQLLKINSVVNEINKDIRELDKQDMLFLFSQSRQFSVAGFTYIKSLISDYLEWVSIDSQLDVSNVQSILSNVKYEDINYNALYEKYFFASRDDLMAHLSALLKISNNPDYREYYTILVLCHLAWIGIDIQDCAQILKSDIKPVKHQLYIRDKNIFIDLDDYLVDLLMEYANAIGYPSQKFGRTSYVRYKESEYLIRTIKSDHLKHVQILTYLRWFNTSHKDYPKRLNYEKIRLSGVYYRAYLYERQYGDVQFGNKDLIERVLCKNGLSTTQANYQLSQYHNYKNILTLKEK